MQDAHTGELVLDPPAAVSYVSTILTLRPGDVIATGHAGRRRHGRTPPRFLADGQLVVTSILGLGELRNRCRREPLPG